MFSNWWKKPQRLKDSYTSPSNHYTELSFASPQQQQQQQQKEESFSQRQPTKFLSLNAQDEDETDDARASRPRFLLDKAGETPRKLESIQIHITLIGTSRVGKSSLIDRFHEDRFTDAYTETVGLKYEEKRVPKTSQGKELIFSCTEIGGSCFDKEDEEELLYIGLSSSQVILFVFDLTRIDTLSWLERVHRRIRATSPQAKLFLVGCKYDLFLLESTKEEQKMTTKAVREYAHAVKAPIVYTSASHSVNCATLFKLIVWKCMGGDIGGVKRISGEEEPIVEYEQ